MWRHANLEGMFRNSRWVVLLWLLGDTLGCSAPNPNVRVRLRGRWHNGVAHLVPDDDPQARLRELPQLNSFGVRTFGANLLTIRVDFTD